MRSSVGPKKRLYGRPGARFVVNAVRLHDPAKEPDAEKSLNGDPLVDEPIVHERISDRESRHSDPDAVRDLSPRALGGDAAVEDEGNRRRCVEDRERIVPLEPAGARRVVRAMHVPEPAMPYPPMKEASPNVHEDGDDRRDGDPDHGVREHRTISHAGVMP